MSDAGSIVDAVRALRRMLASLDSAHYAVEELAPDELKSHLALSADGAMRLLMEIEDTEMYKRMRQEILSHETDSDS